MQLNIASWSDADSVDEKRAWGILFADVARHVTTAFEELEGANPRETAAAIRDQFNGGIDRPTGRHRGGFKK